MILLTATKIESEIADHFEENIEIGKQEYECKFTFDNAEITVPYYLIHDLISYRNNEISATKNGVSYSTDDRDHFRIRRVDVNPHIPTSANNAPVEHDSKLKKPKLRTLQQEIDSIIEHEQNKHEENIKSSEAIEAHNEYLDLNER